MTREEFEETVRKMQDEGVPLSMANLMVRTELPRAQIETWLDAMQRDVRVRPMKPSEASAASDEGDEHGKARGKEGAAATLVDRARALKQEVLGEAAGRAIKEKLGIETRPKPEFAKREIKRAAVLGLVLPPVGLVYSAPWKVTGVGVAMYLAVLTVAWILPFIGIPYLLIPAHIAGGALGAAYAWRYNRAGKRSNLLPGGNKK